MCFLVSFQHIGNLVFLYLHKVSNVCNAARSGNKRREVVGRNVNFVFVGNLGKLQLLRYYCLATICLASVNFGLCR